MDNGDIFSIQPGEVNEASGRLAELADRVKRVLDAEALNLTVQASAGDEVSQRVAATLNDVHASFTKASDRGLSQIQDATGTLKTHTDKVVADDEGLAV
jgi:hypothetical protein